MFENEYDKQEDAMVASVGQELPALLRPQAEVIRLPPEGPSYVDRHLVSVPHCGLQGVQVKYDVKDVIQRKLALHGYMTTGELAIAIGMHANELPVEDFNAALNDLVADGLVKHVGVKFGLV